MRGNGAGNEQQAARQGKTAIHSERERERERETRTHTDTHTDTPTDTPTERHTRADEPTNAHAMPTTPVFCACACAQVDLIDDAAMSKEEAEALAERIKLKFYRTSVQENYNVDEVFTYLS